MNIEQKPMGSAPDDQSDGSVPASATVFRSEPGFNQ